MTIVKFAESQFTSDQIHTPDIALADDLVRSRFLHKVAALKKVAPKANDFVYFSCVMMHSGEAALVDQATGEPKLGSNGKPLTSEWIIDKKGSWKWKCSDPNVLPYKNNNGDIFPESELKKAYRLWVGRPLCKDHQSSSVDGVRGLVVDTYWDDKYKRVVALCALDKINYPDLARKVSTGYATNVSMGTAVGKSICFECGNIARTEAEYCLHVKGKTTYGEINIDLSPIELSIVVTGADPGAKLRSVIASLNKYSKEKVNQVEQLRTAGCVVPGEVDRLENEIGELKRQLSLAGSAISKKALDDESSTKIRNLMAVIDSPNASADAKSMANRQLIQELSEDMSPGELAAGEAGTPAASEAGRAPAVSEANTPYGMAGNYAMTGGRGDATQDPHSSGPVPHWSLDGRESRLAEMGLGAQVLVIQSRLDAMEKALHDMPGSIRATASSRTNKEENNMSKLEERARARRALFDKKAYHQGGGGVNDPQTYPVDPTNDQLKTKGDKQMDGQGLEPGSDGLHPGYQSYGNELELKKKLSRAELEQRRLRREALLSQGEDKFFSDGNNVYKRDVSGNVTQLKEIPKPAMSADDDHDPDEPVDPADLLSQAYWQGGGGVNEPQTYPVDPMNDSLKTDGDKQMEGQGMEPGNDGVHPGYQSYGNEEALRKRLLRADLRAEFIKVFANHEKSDINKQASRWDVYADGEKVMTVKGGEAYDGEFLGQYWDFFSSKDYGRRLMAELRDKGLSKVAYELTGRIVTAQPPIPAPPAPEAAAPPAPPLPAEEPALSEGEEPADAEKTKDEVDDALKKVEEDLAHLKSLLGSEGVATKGKEELPPIEETVPATASSEMQIRVAELIEGLDNSGDELALLSETLGRKLQPKSEEEVAARDELVQIARESLDACGELRKDAALVLEAAKEEEGDDKKEKEDDKDKDLPPFMKRKRGKGKEEESEKKEDKKDKKEEEKEEDKKEDEKDDKKEDKKSEAELKLERMLEARAAKRRRMVRIALGAEEAEGLSERVEALEELEEKEHDIPLGPEEKTPEPAAEDDDDELLAKLLSEFEEEEKKEDEEGEEDFEDEPELDAFDGGLMADAAQRREWREKLASDMEKMAAGDYQLKLDPAADMDTDMVPAAHPQGGYSLEGLDTSPSDEGHKIERIDEIKAKIMKAVESLPPVREAVERVGDLLKSGALIEADLGDEAKLKALAVDPEAAKYWSQYFGEGDQASKQFGQELTKEFVQKKASADADTYRIKLARAYDVALEMQDKGMIDGQNDLHTQVHELMEFDDKAFEAFKKSIDRFPGTGGSVRTASAGKAIEVGVQNEVGEGGHAAMADDAVSLASQLKRIW